MVCQTGITSCDKLSQIVKTTKGTIKTRLRTTIHSSPDMFRNGNQARAKQARARNKAYKVFLSKGCMWNFRSRKIYRMALYVVKEIRLAMAGPAMPTSR